MKKTKKQPVIIALAYPDGSRFEARIPKWKAYLILAELEREEALKQEKTTKPKRSRGSTN